MLLISLVVGSHTLTAALLIFTCIYLFFFGRAVQGLGMGIVVDVYVLAGAVGVILLDMYYVAQGLSRQWSFIVLLLDMSLVFDRPRTVPYVLAFTLLWLVVDTCESSFRMGLYDLVYDSPTLICDCANPPCPDPPPAVGNLVMSVVVLLIDFHLTRGFSRDLRLQLRRVNASVEVASKVTAALARYGVDDAEAAILGGGDLPDALAESFLQLLSNLRSYRAYLPHSCLVLNENGPQADEEAQGSEHEDLDVESYEEDSKTPPDTPKSERSSTSGSSLHLVQKTTSVQLKAAARRSRVSLAAGNKIGYLSSEDLSGPLNARWIAADVERWCAAVQAVHGVVDLIGGDRRYASFNARKGCGTHASAAIEVLASRGEGEWSGCVVTGQAVCGDFGSASVL
eukprot:Hpha_TRINITY_DN15549_c0_g1::TRINITY_DN15549_c0_g1_i1::g.107175::m.107175